jgi:formate hydrogenlyase transcriptional activator
MSEERFKLTFEQAAVGVAHVSLDGRFLRVNEKFCDIIGYTKEEMSSRTFQEITHPDDLDADLEYVQQVLSGEIETYSMEKRYFRKDKTIVWINLTVSLVREDAEDPRYFIAIIQDITERKDAEDKLKISQAIAHIGNWSIQRGEEIVVCSEEVYRIFGLPLGSTCTFELFNDVIHPDDIEYVKSSWMTAHNHDQFDFTYRILVDGQLKWVTVKAESTFYKEDETTSAVGTVQDITDRKLAEKVLEERLQFKKLVASISTKFTGLIGDELSQAIRDALAEIGRYFEVDAVRLYRLSLKGDIIDMRNVWTSGPPASVEETGEMYKMKYPDLAAHYSQGRTIAYSCPDECPPLPDLRKILQYAKIKAGVGVPLEIDDSGVDVFALAKNQSEHEWPQDIIEYCRVIGQIILSAMRRREAEVGLQNSYDEIKQLKIRLEQENIHLRKEIEILYSHDEIVGKSRAIKNVLSQAEQVADQETSVLVLGETGTGKELLARAIHNISPRKERAMITVNCAALPATLVEGELFGREKGAYTGALTKQAGRFELADKSTVFLDEIGDLPLEMQVKLLRVLQEGKFERLGSAKTITVDVRVIAATNHDLEQAVREGRFRKDLFYRLSVFPITVPPLRDRAEDIPMLVWTFVKDFGKRMGKTVENIPNKTMDILMSYTWPGNVRELRNVIERAMILHSGQTLHIEKIQAEDQEIDQPTLLEEVERNHIRSVLARKNWKVSGKNGAAEALGLKESTLRARMGKLGIKRGE